MIGGGGLTEVHVLYPKNANSRICLLSLISSPDLVLAVRGQKKNRGRGRGEGKGEEETRIETSADWLFHNGRESSTRVLFLSLAVQKIRQRSFIELKKIKPTLSDFNRTR